MNGLNRNLAEFTASLDFKKIPADALATAGARRRDGLFERLSILESLPAAAALYEAPP